MAISLSKGGNINLSKTAPTMNKVDLGLGWNPRVTDGKAFDLDAVAFLTGEDGKVRVDGDFIFFNQKTSPCGSVNHKGDNRTGDGDGDDEAISVDLSKVPADVAKIVFAVTIHEGQQNGQNFGQVDKVEVQSGRPGLQWRPWRFSRKLWRSCITLDLSAKRAIF